jgi:hypothetical protein
MASDPTTWANLKTSLANWMNRDDLSTTEIPEAIAFAERHFNRALRVPEMEAVSSATLSSETISLPADFLEARAIYISADPKITLEPMSLSDLRSTYAAAATGRPQNYAFQVGAEMVVGPAPDASYTIVMNYYASIPALGAGQATNWLLTSHSDLYRAASLAELCALTGDDERANRWEAKTASLIEEVKNQGQRKARGAGPVRIRSSVIV